MRYVLCTIILLLTAVSVRAAETSKPYSPTPKEIQDGWLLLFDGKTTFGWKIDGEAKVEQGALVLGGEKETTATTSTHFGTFACRLNARAEGGQAGWNRHWTPDKRARG
jgi:hypothetical protein